jgi:hypothetical protein
MITTTGKSIIAKYLIDQAPSYAAYIAVGCGLNPRASSFTVKNKQLSGTTITLTTSAAHSLVAGDKIFVSGLGPLFDGARTVASVTSTTVLITTTALPATTAIVHSTPAAGSARATTATAHGLSVGDIITIAETTEFNNTDVVVSAVTATTFDFPDASTTNGADVIGTITIDVPDNGSISLDFSSKEKLDFEMFRVPIISRSYSIDENGVSQVVFSAELPTQEIYYMTEAGIFSAGSNPVAVTSDSRLLHSFSSIENWEYHSATVVSIPSPTQITNISTGIMEYNLDPVFFINNTEDMFSDTNIARGKKHLEQPRMLENSVAVAGNLSTINTSAATWTASGEPHIHLTSQSYPLDVNSSSDEIALAFSLLKRNVAEENPTFVNILVEFSSEEAEAVQSYARMQIQLSSTDFDSNGSYTYFVKKKTLAELKKSSNFSWTNAKIIKVYCDVIPTTRTISNKVLTNNIATITTTAAHYVAIGDSVTVALSTPDAVFDGVQTVTAVTTTSPHTISYAKTNANVGTTAAAGTLTRDGQSTFIALDGLRFENNFDMTANPLYGMTAYSPISSSTNTTIFKDANSKNLLDMKIVLDIGMGS